jgi:hypothetical protein
VQHDRKTIGRSQPQKYQPDPERLKNQFREQSPSNHRLGALGGYDWNQCVYTNSTPQPHSCIRKSSLAHSPPAGGGSSGDKHWILFEHSTCNSAMDFDTFGTVDRDARDFAVMAIESMDTDGFGIVRAMVPPNMHRESNHSSLGH